MILHYLLYENTSKIQSEKGYSISFIRLQEDRVFSFSRTVGHSHRALSRVDNSFRYQR